MIRKNMFDDLMSPEEKLSRKTRKFVNNINSRAKESKYNMKHGIMIPVDIIPLEELKKRVSELKTEHVRLGIQPTQEFSHLIDIVENGIKVPKFRFFGDRKYKKVQKLFTPDYTIKLYTGEIESSFESEEDFRDVKKWKEFIDKKEEEYKRKTGEGYEGSFENYLQEPALVTIESLESLRDSIIHIEEEHIRKTAAFENSELYRSVSTEHLRILQEIEEREKRKKQIEEVVARESKSGYAEAEDGR